MILAYLLFEFDLKSDDPERKIIPWEDQRTFALWTRAPFELNLTAARAS